MATSDDRTLSLDQTTGAIPTPSAGAVNAPPGYAILRELGRGGMGIVFLARQVALDRLCALKMLRSAEYANDIERQRFVTEARATARLTHPHIVQIYEVGEHQGLPFMALEYCPGGSLDAVLVKQPLAPPSAAELVRILATAVHSGHQVGILHRDIKPSNVLLADGEPKLGDFGLARMHEGASRSEATASGAVLGTPSYMPPEQARGERDIGPAADVYSLGALLYACLTGRPPHLAATVLETLMQVMSDEPVAVRQVNPSVPRDLETIVHKCLQKDPHKRYASAQHLADDLQRHQEGRPIQARPVGLLERAWRWVRRNPVVSALAGLVFVVLLVGILVSARYAEEARQQAELAKAREAEARTEAHRANLARHAGIIENGLRAWRERDLARVEELLAEIRPEFRDRWEVRHLRDVLKRSYLDLPGHTREVTSVTFSRAGKLAFSASHDGTVRIWDADTGKHLRTVQDPAIDFVYSVAAHPDGKTFATGSGDGNVRLWATETGRLLHTIRHGDRSVFVVRFSPDGRHLLSAGNDGFITLWDVANRQPWQILPVDAGETSSADFSPDGQRLVTASDGWIRVWDVATGEILTTVDRTDAPNVFAVAFAPDGQRFALSDYGLTVQVRDVWSGAVLVEEMPGLWNNVQSLAFSPDGQSLAGASGDETVYIWNSRSAQLRYRLTGQHARAQSVVFSPNGRTVLSGAGSDQFNPDRKGQVRLWRLDTQQSADELVADQDVRSVAFFPDGSLLSFGFRTDPTVRRWGRPRQRDSRILAHKHTLHVDLFPGGDELFQQESESLIRRDARTGQILTVLREETSANDVYRLSPEGDRFVSRTYEVDPEGKIPPRSPVQLHDARTGTVVETLHTGENLIQGVAFRPDGQALLCLDEKNFLQSWNRASGTMEWCRRIEMSGISDFCFSPDSARVCVFGGPVSGLGQAPRTGSACLLDTRTGEEQIWLKGHAGRINSAAFSPDGTLLATGSDDRTIRLWDVATGQQVLVLEGSRTGVESVAFSPDGKTIASPDGKSIRLWQAPQR